MSVRLCFVFWWSSYTFFVFGWKITFALCAPSVYACFSDCVLCMCIWEVMERPTPSFACVCVCMCVCVCFWGSKKHLASLYEKMTHFLFSSSLLSPYVQGGGMEKGRGIVLSGRWWGWWHAQCMFVQYRFLCNCYMLPELQGVCVCGRLVINKAWPTH